MNHSKLITNIRKYLSASEFAAEYAARQVLINNLKTLCQVFLAQSAELELLHAQPGSPKQFVSGYSPITFVVTPTWCPADVPDSVREAVTLACTELQRARDSHAPMHSAHEGYAVLKEEVEELWEEIKRKPCERDPQALQAEAVQVAAMSLRFLVDIALPMQESQE